MTKTLSSQARLFILFGASLGLGLLFNYLFYEKVPGVSFPILVALILFSLWFVARCWDIRFPKGAWVPAVAALFFASMLAVRADPFLGFLNVFASFYLLALSTAVIVGGFRWDRLRSFIYLFGMPFRFLRSVPWSVSCFMELRPSAGKSTSEQAVRGILMALPVLFLFTLLFASADLVIRDYLMRIFEFEDLPRALARTVLVLAVSVFAAGTFGYILSKKGKDDDYSADAAQALSSKRSAKISTVQVSVFLGAIALLFLGFIAVQSLYLFGGDAALAGQDFTYAEYARRGFFELLAVALITFALLWASESAVLRQAERHSRRFKAVAGVLVFEVLLIIFSAFLRLRLYEDAFGLTTLRLWSHAFAVWLTVAFVMFIWKILQDQGDRAFLVSAFVSLMLALAVMNALNPDAFIARRNIERSFSGERFDALYIASLSDDAMPQMLATFDNLQGEEKSRFASILARRPGQRAAEEYSSWQSFNLSRRQAEKLLSGRMGEIDRYARDGRGLR